MTVLEREGAPRPIEVLRLSDRPFAIPRINVRERTLLPQAKLDSAPWHLLPREDLNFARRLQASHPRLTEVAMRVSAGPATGRDGIFTFPAGSQLDIEPELLRRAVRGRHIEAYGVAEPKLEVLIPYTFGQKGEPSLIALNDFPGAGAYLRRHCRELATRHCVRVWRKDWYDLHDQIVCDLAREPKILVPDVAKNNRFAVDEGTFFPLHSVYYIRLSDGIDPYYLVGVLNSPVATFLIRLFAPVVRWVQPIPTTVSR